jgi:3',5'-cyclic AMP phosphodiesterase CpdA
VIRLLQLSDLHFHDRPNRIGLPDSLVAFTEAQSYVERLKILREAGVVGSDQTDVAASAAAFVKANPVDMVIVTGDVATTGTWQDLAIAWNWLHALGVPWIALPGNHDRFKSEVDLFPPGNPQFDYTFPTWSARQGVQVMFQRDNVTVIGADFTLQAGDYGEGPFGHLGQGRVRQELVDELVRQSDLGTFAIVIWAIHFEPDAGDAALALLDDDLLIAECTNEPTAIICGHTHKASRVKTFSGIPVLCCGTTLQESQYGNWINILEIDDKVVQRRFKYDGTAFVEQA